MGRKLYIGNLNWNTTEDAIRQAFSANGTVSEVAIILDRETGRPRGFAFVTMSSDEEARAAAENMAGTMLDGRPLRVNEAQERRPGGGDFEARPPSPNGRGAAGGFRNGPPRSDFRTGMPGGGRAPSLGSGGGGGDLEHRPSREFRVEAPRADAGWSDAGGGGRGGAPYKDGGRGGRGLGPAKDRGRGGKPGRSREDEWRGNGGGRRGSGEGGGWDEDLE